MGLKFALCAAIFLSLFGCGKKGRPEIRIGYAPNLTHAQALIGLAEGWFETAVKPGGDVRGRIFHAGPSIIEALFSGAIDAAYVGPVPAVNSFLRSGGRFVVVSGAAIGGAGVVAAPRTSIASLDDLIHQRLATPQLGNTQDVTARAAFLGKKGKPDFNPAPNPEHLVLFRNTNVDASWTVEPWVSRLIEEEGGRLIFNEAVLWRQWGFDDYPTTVILARKSFVEQNPELMKKFLAEHVRITKWIKSHSGDAKEICARELGRLLGKPLPPAVINRAWSHIEFSDRIQEKALEKNAQNLWNVGFLKNKPSSLAGLVDDRLLNEVAKEKQP